VIGQRKSGYGEQRIRQQNINEKGKSLGRNSEKIQLSKFKRNQTGHESAPRMLEANETAK